MPPIKNTEGSRFLSPLVKNENLKSIREKNHFLAVKLNEKGEITKCKVLELNLFQRIFRSPFFRSWFRLYEETYAEHVIEAVKKTLLNTYSCDMKEEKDIKEVIKKLLDFSPEKVTTEINKEKISLKKAGFRSVKEVIEFSKHYPLSHIDLSELEGLKRVEVEELISTNANSLESLSVEGGEDFKNLNLEQKKLVKLKALNLSGLSEFNQAFLNLPGLEALSLINLPNFNHSLKNLSSLIHVSLAQLPKFNQPLKNLSSLIHVSLAQLPKFNQPLEDLSNLASLVLHDLPQFKQSLEKLKEVGGDRSKIVLHKWISATPQIEDELEE